MIIKCPRCDNPVNYARPGGMCLECGHTFTYMESRWDCLVALKMGKARGLLYRYTTNAKGEVVERKFPTTHKKRRKHVAEKRRHLRRR